LSDVNFALRRTALTAAFPNGGTLKLLNKTAPYDESREGLFLASCSRKVFNPTRRSIQQKQQHARFYPNDQGDQKCLRSARVQ
jgi:hypothetical protein